MSKTYERPSAPALNGPATIPPTSGFDPTADTTEGRRAIDVVRLAVVDRLVRSGVPVACAVALVQAAETLARTAI